jgi:hypothetical protein
MNAEKLLMPVMCFAAGVLAMDVAHDFRQAELAASLDAERRFYLAQTYCTPAGRYETAVQRWEGGRLVCAIHGNVGYGRASKVVASLDIPGRE